MAFRDDALMEMRTRLLKRHAEELAEELADVDPLFDKAAIVLLAMSDHGDDDDAMQRVTMVSNIKRPEHLRSLLHFVGDREVLGTRRTFEKGH